MGRLGATRWLVILVVVFVYFGGKKIPELMKGLGTGVKEFKDAAKGEENHLQTQKKRKKNSFLKHKK